ncbi:hypothetical protein CC80DRAFT_544708 [Byssothecium circinans]|uniref:Aminoglycoside phosphotransferase domain-containing protein n=1 Tax=Byssothecium circinans TaxID=147558 RepID=A0A6A5U6F1_9PLEO|nr:hypothetical protein CC80DRAFT_544708 [Byssothecium circinans]
MRSKTEIYQKYYNVQTYDEARALYDTIHSQTIPLSSATKLQLPYEAASHPGIPSFDEIDKGMKENHFKLRFHGSEAEDLLYLQANSQVRTPKVYAVFTRDEEWGLATYMVTELIEGERFSGKLYMSLSDEGREKLLARLCEQLRLLRATPSEGYYGRVHNQGWSPLATPFHGGGLEMYGPYKTYEDFVSALNACIEIVAALCSGHDSNFYPEQELFLSGIKDSLAKSKGSRPTFTHIDPAGQNIIVRKLQGSEQGAEGWEVTFIDWSDSGWYPAWMQAWTCTERIHLFDGYGAPHYNEESRQIRQKVLQSFEDPYSEEVELYKKLGEEADYSII